MLAVQPLNPLAAFEHALAKSNMQKDVEWIDSWKVQYLREGLQIYPFLF